MLFSLLIFVTFLQNVITVCRVNCLYNYYKFRPSCRNFSMSHEATPYKKVFEMQLE